MKKAILLLCIVALAFLSASNTTENDQSNDKIIICHIPPGNPENAHPIEISVSALQAHLAHGDSIGDCSGNDDRGDEGDEVEKGPTN